MELVWFMVALAAGFILGLLVMQILEVTRQEDGRG